MRNILRRHELTADEWRYPGEDPGAAARIVPLAEFTADPAAALSGARRLGVQLAPTDAVTELVPFLKQLALVALEFPTPGDGRAFSQGHTLRAQLGFAGELRAIGAGVRQDLIFLMARCGFDAFELPADEDPQGALRALTRYDVAYQPGAAQVALREQRFPRASAAAV
jgi:uncharacterized protein (DUF934 family)